MDSFEAGKNLLAQWICSYPIQFFQQNHCDLYPPQDPDCNLPPCLSPSPRLIAMEKNGRAKPTSLLPASALTNFAPL